MSEENVKKGGISVDSEHLFPIIKKWLYSEKEIFLREIVSNACDAVTKLRRLTSLGQADFSNESFRVDVKLDKDAKTLTVSDNGIGMTAEELEKYICNIALSGALDFISKYEGKDAASDGIIGHFGLGFYSSFMVADKVDVITKSYLGSDTMMLTCSENGEYEISKTDERDTRGTDVVMHITEESAEYLSSSKIRSILDKYCSFMPVEIYFDDGEKHEEDKKEGEESKEPEAPKPVNDVSPLWQKAPADCTDEEYKEFYRKVFSDYREPLFWIHINADYPLNFKGILYFPKIAHEYESLEGQVKLYYNQVFVADNIKEIIPEYFMMLKGVLDCPELPLNVSRSYLQNNGYVSKIQAHIAKKVSDKLSSMLANDREAYEKIWPDIRTFVEYGALRDSKFADRIKDSVLFSLTDGKCVTLPEYLEKAKATNENKVYYTTDKVGQSQYVSMYNSENIDVVVLDTIIDTQYITKLEGDNKDVKFKRVDAESDSITGKETDLTDDDKKALEELFKKASGKSELKFTFASFKNSKAPCIINSSEQTRRYEDMMKMYGMDGLPESPDLTLVINTASPIIASLKGAQGENAEEAARYAFDLALLSYRRLTGDEMKDFLDRGYAILEKLK